MFNRSPRSSQIAAGVNIGFPTSPQSAKYGFVAKPMRNSQDTSLPTAPYVILAMEILGESNVSGFVDIVQTRNYYLGVGIVDGNVYKSFNLINWQLLAIPPYNLGGGVKMLVLHNGLILALSTVSANLLVSRDGGKSWSINPSLGFSSGSDMFLTAVGTVCITSPNNGKIFLVNQDLTIRKTSGASYTSGCCVDRNLNLLTEQTSRYYQTDNNQIFQTQDYTDPAITFRNFTAVTEHFIIGYSTNNYSYIAAKNSSNFLQIHLPNIGVDSNLFFFKMLGDSLIAFCTFSNISAKMIKVGLF